MSSTTLLATDQQRSVLNTLKANQPPQAIAYSPYGHRPAACWLLSLLGFNGELADPMTGHYLLGNGYRVFNSVLMRFNSPDSLSPFGAGLFNTYAYCLGDPVNLNDPTGHAVGWAFVRKNIQRIIPQDRPIPISRPAPGNKYTRLAYHGTSNEQLPSLLNGLDKKFMGRRGAQKLGEGFYSTDSFEQAVRYAREAADTDKSTPVVVKTYVKDLKGIPIKTPEQGSVFSRENRINPPIIRDESVYMIPPERYGNVVLMKFENPAWVSDYRIPGRRRIKEGAYEIRKR